jgi:hypothetical protein
MLSRAVLTAAAVAVAVAQDWGTTGAWEVVAPSSTGSGIVPFAFRKPTTIAGCEFPLRTGRATGALGGPVPPMHRRQLAHRSIISFGMAAIEESMDPHRARTPPPSAGLVVAGNNSATGNIAMFTFDIIANAWSKGPDVVPPAGPIGDPFLFQTGGFIAVIDELNPNALAVIDSSNTAGGWTYPTPTGGPAAARFGQRFVMWGTLLYTFSGVEVATGVLHSDMWAMDMGALITRGASTWVNVAADGVSGMPPGRVGYSWTDYAVGMVMMGGVTVNTPGLLPDICFDPTQSSNCFFHRAVWAFVPGQRGVPAAGSITGGAWILLAEAGAYGGPVPTGRFDHTSAAMGDQLFIFGGTTATGTSTEMWVYNLVSQTWALVTRSAPWPSASTDIGYGSGIGIGRHLYQVVQFVDPTSGYPVPNTAQLWRWAPSASSGNSPAAAADPPVHPAVSAGIAIGCLLGFANLAFLVVLAQNAGILPSSCGGAAGGKRTVSGYYAGVPSSSDYAPPMA